MRRFLATVLALSCIPALAAKPAQPSAAIEQAKYMASVQEMVRNQLNDPESARFRNVFVAPDGFLVCGEINAKNRMGGYVGFRRFIAVGEHAFFEDEKDTFVAGYWQRKCVAHPPDPPVAN
jgi:hypothetical protein